MDNRTLSKSDRYKVFQRDGYRCRYCGITKGKFEVDHVYPYSLGGATTVENSAVICGPCNRRKHNHIGVWPLPVVEERDFTVLDNYYRFMSSLGFLLSFILCVGILVWFFFDTSDLLAKIVISAFVSSILVYVGLSLRKRACEPI